MTTIKEFKEWLDRFPEDTIVEVAIQEESHDYDPYGAVSFKSPNLEDSDWGMGWEFTDFRNNQYIKKGSPRFGKCVLAIGEKR